MRNIISFFIKYPIWSNAIIVVTALGGLISLFTLNHSFFPELAPNNIYITVTYPGASPIEIEEGITTRIEENLEGIEGIKEISSSSSENFAKITVEAFEGIDINLLTQDVKNAVDGISSMPKGAEPPIVVAQKSRGMSGMGGTVGFISLESNDGDLFALKLKADEVKSRLLADPAISQIEVVGYPPQIIAIDIRANDLTKFGLTIDAVSKRIQMQNLDLSAGSIKTNKEELYIRLMNKTTDAELLKNVVIKALPDGQLIRLKDIADVNFEFSEIALKSKVNNKQNITILVKKLNTEHLGKISDALKKNIKEFNAENDNYKMRTLFMFSDLLDQRISMLSKNLVIGLLLVLVVLGLFLSLRLSLWVAFGIPFSMLGMFWMGSLYGMSINMISLFGMILVVGILVDDGIVIAESIYSHFERGKSSVQAAIDGTMDVLSSVFTSVLTTIVSFGFLLFVGGDMAMMEEMAFSVVACLAFSLVEAFLVLPSHLANKKMLEPSKIKGYQKVRNRIEGVITKMRNAYERLLTYVVKRYRYFVWGPMLFIGFVIFLFNIGYIKWAFYPKIPFNDIQVDFAYQPGDREMQTDSTLVVIQDIIFAYQAELEEEFGEEILTYVSSTLGNAQRLGESGNHAGSLRISLKEQNHISVYELSNELKKRMPEKLLNSFEKFSLGGDTPFGYDISLSIQSTDRDEIAIAAKWLNDKITGYDEVKDLADNSGVGNRELWLNVFPKAYALGLDELSIVNQVRQGFFGQEVQRLIIGKDEVKVWARFPIEDRNDFDDLDKLKIKTPTGQEYLLNQLADYQITRGSVSIRHLDGVQEIRLKGSLYNGDLASMVNARIVEEVFPELEAKFPNTKIKLKGQAEKAADSATRMGISFLLSILLIMIILSLNFGSFYQAKMIMMVIPVGIVSAMLGHGVVGIPFSIFSFWGIIALVGILVNDAVVMLDQYNKGLKSGLSAQAAVIQAGQYRFRPIILTSITTVVGLYPLILETSFQAQFLVPMAVSVAYGVLIGTLMLLFFFPPMLMYFNDMRRARFWFWRGGKYPPTKIEVEPVYKIYLRSLEMEQPEDAVFFDEKSFRIEDKSENSKLDTDEF
ncbi:MAG: multidrug efflux pump subunit AcrB [Parvicella sp.]|jgi:multidrug efflux pump subunit AcrB